MHKVVEECCNVKELKNAIEDLKQEKCVEGEDKRILQEKRKEERELECTSDSDSDWDSIDDEMEEKHGDMLNKLFDG